MTSKLSSYVGDRMAGRPTEPVPGEPVNPSKRLRDSIKAKLSGQDVPTPDETDAATSAGDQPTAEEEAYQQMEPDLQAACDDPSDADHAVGMRLWKAQTAWIEIQRARAEGV